nr:unnamed protein product [Callosobruchus chinensis]CAH7741821.1 unnamed protein product [Callosobruchus chinensis]
MQSREGQFDPSVTRP